ncbi:hypothetical protein VP01_1371g2 [Puccinia sorghi]|uniref:BZIP domain-containing protein n=1 Tax=Puccinia sorghi TaxID=27349 RepID=A0A0L6VLM9_9BASI|nr:hypothetical protein VP01_1371g2 [Puccinia sorghi]
MADLDCDFLLQSFQPPAMDEQRTPVNTPAEYNPQPTRSGRIPQKPASTTLNPLDFLDFPDESESDDPDFDPLNQQESSNVPSPHDNDNQQLNHTHFDLLAHINAIGFDFSTLSDQPQQTWPSNSFIQYNHNNKNNNTLNQIQFTQQASSPKLSPLTQGELAGVPFVNINLPDSDDSPEFIPPPTTRSTAASSSSRPSKRPRRETTSRVVTPINTSTLPTQSTQQLSCSSTKLAPSISSRYIAIAPSLNYPAEKHETIDDSDHSEDGPLDQQQDTDTTVGRTNNLSRAMPDPKPRKPLSLQAPPSHHHHHHQHDDDIIDGREDSMKRKREGMRKNRERKKIYIVSLEDRCLELAEENARLREENQELIRESRENWKAKAKSLEVFKLLNQQIQRLQGVASATGSSSSSSRGWTGVEDATRRTGPTGLKRKADSRGDQQRPFPPPNPSSRTTHLTSASLLKPASASAPVAPRPPTRYSARGRTLLDVLSSSKSKRPH